MKRLRIIGMMVLGAALCALQARDTLHAPWREHYKDAQGPQSNIEGCVFCALGQHDAAGNYVLARCQYCLVMFNKHPYSKGHIMVIPYQHTGTLSDLSQNVRHELFEVVSQSADILQRIMGNTGYNIGINTGLRAGGSIPDHLHVHIVPRYGNDPSFMDIAADTHVVAWDLERLYTLLAPHFEDLV